MIWQRKVKSQGQSIDFDQTLALCKISEEKGGKISETREKIENFDIKYVIFREEWDLLWFIENQ